MKNAAPFFVLLSFVVLIPPTQVLSEDKHAFIDTDSFQYEGTLKAVMEHRRLRVLTSPNAFNFFIEQGERKGYEYEIASKLVEHLNRKFRLNGTSKKPIILDMIPVQRDELVPMLQDGYGDVIAAGFTKTERRERLLDFSLPYNTVKEVLVTHNRIPNLTSWEQLSEKTVAVRESSSYFESISAINEKLLSEGTPPINVEFAPEEMETDQILELVSLKKYNYTFADSHIAEMATKVFGNLKIHPQLVSREKAEISWAVSPGADKLLAELNDFLPRFRKGTLHGNMSLSRYFENISAIGLSAKQKAAGKVSKFDAHFKKFGEKYDWDWRLLASLAYQESRFRQNIKNKWGAIGVFQIKEFVAREPYVNILPIEGRKHAVNNIHAGTKYLSWLRKTYYEDESAISASDRIQLTLASYNAGPGRIRKARRLAEKMGLDPNKWNKNVEHSLLAMHRIEPVKYVNEIKERFQAYVLLGIK